MDTADPLVESDFGPWAREWDQLADRVGAPPFLRPTWFRCWWGAFGSGRLEVHTVRREGRLVGVMPLRRRHGELSALANYHSPAFAPLAEDSDALDTLLCGALSASRRRLALPLVTLGEPVVAQLEGSAGSRRRVLAPIQLRTPVVEVDGEWDAYVAGLGRSFRKELRRLRRRLSEAGQVELEVISDRGSLEGATEAMLRLEGSHWKREQGTAIASRPETRRFYEEVAGWAADRGWLRLFFLHLSGNPIAVDLALEQDGRRYMLKGGFDGDHAKLAPGTVLLELGLEHAFAAQLGRVELGGGDDSYKLRWTKQVRERALLQAYPATAAGLIGWAANAYARPLAKRAMSAARGRVRSRSGAR